MQDAAFMHTVTDKEQPVKDSMVDCMVVITNFTSCICLFFLIYFFFLKEFTKVREMSFGCVTFDGRLLKRSQQHVFG